MKVIELHLTGKNKLITDVMMNLIRRFLFVRHLIITVITIVLQYQVVNTLAVV